MKEKKYIHIYIKFVAFSILLIGDKRKILCVWRLAIIECREFPDGLCSQCRGHGFDPWLGTKIPHAVQHSQKIKLKKNVDNLITYLNMPQNVFSLIRFKVLHLDWVS